jgi:parallel beta-helix repeat protein
MSRMRTARVVLLSLAVSGALAPLTGPASVLAGSATFVVNRTGDGSDMNLADTKCDTSTTTGNQCSLRAAIQEANDTPGSDTINFNITSASKVIQPSSPLPPITDPVTINGYSQTGSSENTLVLGSNAVLKIVLDGVNAGSFADGLVLASAASIVRGLSIQNWDNAAILITGSGATDGPNIVSGCYLGTDVSGTLERGNDYGVRIEGSLNYVGGPSPGSRNVISANQTGVWVEGVSSPVIVGNYIGTNAAGTAALGNNNEGIRIIDSDHAQVGGSTAAERNVISANGNGVEIDGDGVADNSNVVTGNYIGTKADGTGDLGNYTGVSIQGGTNNIIGMPGAYGNLIANGLFRGVLITSDSPGNTIEGNTIKGAKREDGLQIRSGPNTVTGNSITGNARNGIRLTRNAKGVKILNNSMSANGGLGINLVGGTENGFKVTANDKKDPDTGANNLQNFPVLASAIRNASTGVTEVVVVLNTNPNTEIRVELFRAAVDQTSHGEGQTRIATHVTTTNASGDKTFSFLLTGVSGNTPLTATATATSSGNTSEFSANRTVTN